MGKGERYTTAKFIHLVISLFFLFVFGWICPTWGDVTRQGVQIISIFIGGTWMIANRFGMAAPSILIMLAIVLTGYTTGDAIIASSLGSSIVWQLITIFLLVYALTKSGADGVLARWMISRKFLKGHPMLFAPVFFLAVASMSAVASGLGAFLFSTAMVDSVAETVGFEENGQWKKSMYLGSVVCASIGGAIIPFKGIAMMVYSLMNAGLAEADVYINQMTYMATAILAVALVTIVLGISIGTIFKTDLSKLSTFDITSIMSDGESTFTKRQIWTFALFVVGFAYSVVLLWLPETVLDYTIFSSIGQGTWFAAIAALMFIIHVDGRPLLEIDEAMGKAVRWGIILAVCAFTSIGGMLADETLGVRGWLAEVMGAVFGSMPFPVFVVCVVLSTMLLTNFFSNTATAVIVGTIIGPQLITYGLQLGINISCVIPGVVVSACAAFLTMAAGGMAPIYLGSGAVKDDQRWVFTWGLLVFPIVTIVSSLVYIVTAYLF